MSKDGKVETVQRRTWDRDYYEARAKERLEKGDDFEEKESGPARRSKKEEFQPAESGAAGPAGSQRAYLKVKDRFKMHKKKEEERLSGASQKLSAIDDFDARVREQEDNEARRKRQKKEAKKAKKAKEEEEIEFEDPEMAALMGFGGFGGGAKSK